MHPDLISFEPPRPHVVIPVEQALRSGPGPSSHSKTFQITLRAPAGAVLEAELLGGVWSLKPFERQRDLVGRSDYDSADLAHFLPRRADCPLRKGYRTRMDMARAHRIAQT
jgi:hypothetical protein